MAGAFVGRLLLDFGDWGPTMGRIAILAAPITWRGITVPAGTMSDGATVPRPLWWFLPPWGDPATIAAILHDYLCDCLDNGTPAPGANSRMDCDRLFRDALFDIGIPAWRAWACWCGVRLYSLTVAR